MEATTAPGPRVDPRLVIAIGGGVLLHGALLVGGTFRRTYDAYVHLFFADHYARDWFSTWDTRWYTGFTTTSYPPGTHQLVAALSHLIGLQAAFVVVQLVAIVLLIVGVYRFSLLWVSREAAGWAAILLAFSSSIAITVHTFGQLPTTFALGMLLNATPFVDRWIGRGALGDLARAVAVTAATTAAHHVTTLFGTVFFLGPVVVRGVVEAFRTPLDDEAPGRPVVLGASTVAGLSARRLRRCLPALTRAAMYGATVIAGLVFVVLPYWVWSRRDPISQIPIPHASRANFLDDVNAGLVFWLIPWGVLLIALPFALARGISGRAWPLTLSVGLLALLGTGGTTPIPRLLLGGAFDILTLDRFTFWATIAVLPLAGWFVESLTSGYLYRVVRADFGQMAARALAVGLGFALVALAVFSANLASLRSFQPDPIEMDPIVEFLEKDQHDRWRYLTLGFGDQMAWLSAQTEATTVDGNYHSVRRLPELTSTPVERLEGAKFRGVPGIGSLQQFLAIPSKYHLKFVFSNDEFYDPLLWSSGWHRLERLRNGIVVWEREDIAPLPPELPVNEISTPLRLIWGIAPMTTVAAAAAAMASTAPARASSARHLTRWAGVPLAPVTGAIDRRLQRAAAGLSGPVSSRPRWQPFAMLSGKRLRSASPSWWRRGSLVGAVLLAGFGITLMASDEPLGPAETVEAYYDDLDFRRIEQARQRLDPQTRPSAEYFELERSTQDGLLASYAKLESIRTRVIEIDGEVAIVQAELDFVTALSAHRQVVVHDLVRRDGEWFLVPDQPDLVVPPEQFVRRTAVEFIAQGRRRTTTATTAYADVIDRPEVVTSQAQLVRIDDRWVVVGEVVNTDVDPADVTVTAQLLGADGEVLAQYDAAQILVHKLLPNESSPFRVEFEGIAGALDVRDPAAGEFDPTASTPLQIGEGEVASFAIYTKAVVTGREVDRNLVLQDLRVEQDDDGWWLVGSVRNDGVETITIPHLVIGHRSAEAGLIWVDHAYVDRAVRPQRSQEFRIELSDLTTLRDVELEGVTFDNGLGSDDATTTHVRIDTEHPSVDHLTIAVAGFVRSTS